MPSYFFHVRDQGERIEDPDGLDLPDLRFVLDQCRGIVQEVLCEQEWRDTLDADRKFEIADERGRVVLVVPFSAVQRTAERPGRQAAWHG